MPTGVGTAAGLGHGAGTGIARGNARAPGTRDFAEELNRTPKIMFIDSDKFHEECGVMAIYAHPEASTLAYLGLHALQHRGQESAGIASSDSSTIYMHKAMGLVMDIFSEDVLARLPGSIAIGHNRYSQPAVVESGSSSLGRGRHALSVVHQLHDGLSHLLLQFGQRGR